MKIICWRFEDSDTLIDNLFSKVIDPDIILSILAATSSGHPPQFTIIPNMFGNISGNKSITENVRKAFNDENKGCRVFVELQKVFDTVGH